MKKSIFYLFLSSLICVSCSHIREARQTIAIADSLLMYGELYKDSMNIARAVETFNSCRAFYSGDYARANYFYGRLLREKGKQQEAIQCFLNVLHSRSCDHDLRGRTYTNMAVMCRQEGNHQLSYNLFELSAQEFLGDKDTTAYYYALNSMAFELAEQAKKDECLSLLSEVEQNCKDKQVLLKILETKAEASFMVHQYDSAVYYADLLQKQGNSEPTGMLVKAQAYYYLGQKDSALLYAKEVAANTSSLFDLNNSYYILANEDKEAELAEIRQIHAERSDIQKQIELRHADLSHAVEIMQQDLNKEPDYKGIVIFGVAIILIVGITVAICFRMRSKHMQLQAEQSKLQEQIEQHSQLRQQQIADVEKLCEALRQSHDIRKELKWSDFNTMCETVNAHFNFFANKLKATHSLSETEIRLCVLVLIDLRFKQISEILPYALNSVGKLKDTAAKHLGTTGKQLRKSLLNMVIDSF